MKSPLWKGSGSCGVAVGKGASRLAWYLVAFLEKFVRQVVGAASYLVSFFKV